MSLEWDEALAAELEVLAVRHLPDGRLIGMTRERHWVVWVGDRTGKSRAFEYPSLEAARQAVETWDGEAEPVDGWVRAWPPHFRRRPDRSPDSEYVAP